MPLFQEVIHGLKEENGGTISTVEFANRLGEVPLLYQPGQSWSYGTSADVVGAVIEVASGMRFGDFLKKEIFEPLGMNDTDFWVPAEKQDRLAKVYDCREDSRPSVIWTITLAFRTIWRTARHMRQAEQALHLPSTIMRNLRRCC